MPGTMFEYFRVQQSLDLRAKPSPVPRVFRSMMIFFHWLTRSPMVPDMVQ